MLSEILWPSGVNIGSTNKAVQDVLSYYVDSMQLSETSCNKVNLIKQCAKFDFKSSDHFIGPN